MSNAQTIPQWIPRRSGAAKCASLAAVVIAGCVPLPRSLPEPLELVLIPAVIAAPAALTPVRPTGVLGGRVPLTTQSMTVLHVLRMDVPRSGSWIAGRASVSADSFPYSTHAAVLVFGGATRDAAAVLSVLHADSGSRRAAAADLRRSVSARRLSALVLVPGASAARDAAALISALGELGAAARAGGAGDVIVAVVGTDTAAFPSRALADVADALLIDLQPPAPVAAPGPPVSIDEMRRIVALRASEIGRGRLVLLLPVHGYAWLRDSLPRAVSFDEGTRLVSDWRAQLVRDPGSGGIVARSEDRGELWLIDGRFVARLVREARVMGVRRFAIVLGAGEDPAIPDSLAASLQTINSSR